MKQRCPHCESWSAEGASRCPCGHHFGSSSAARIHRPTPPREDDGRVLELRLASRKDIRNGIALVAFLVGVNLALFALNVLYDLNMKVRPNLFPTVGLIWGVILIIRGLRVRREAWELEHLGFIERERSRPQ
jgi:hypothetical protein